MSIEPQGLAGRAAEVHIAGVLIHAHPPALADVVSALAMLPNAEATQTSPDGRAVAVLEAGSSRGVLDQLDAIRAIHGVLNVALVYQHVESEADMNKEMQE